MVGVRLSKELMAVAGEALKVNVTTLGPLVLPLSEQVGEGRSVGRVLGCVKEVPGDTSRERC